jgi:hypothetical protein
MSLGNIFKSDLFDIYNVVQGSMLVYPKEVILATLKDSFSKDSYYHYSKDQWGFCNVTDHTDLPLGADLPYGSIGSTSSPNDLLSTRVFIGENYHHDGIYYPAILVKSGGSKYVPISINREKGSVNYDNIIYVDGYGNKKEIKRPISFITAGVWEGSIIVDVITRSLRARDDLIELIGLYFSEIHVDSLYDVGLIVKPPNIGAPSESEDRNDKLFKQSITMDIRTEWKREIPISNIIDAIFFTVTFEDLSRPNIPVSPNITINTETSILDIILQT